MKSSNQITGLRSKFFCLAMASLVLGSFASTQAATISDANYGSYFSRGNAPTPLCMAISKGDLNIVKKFVEYGADINETSNGMTPLMVAARFNRTEIVKFLIESGAKLESKSENGFTALKWAEASGSKEVAEILKNTSRKA